MYFWIGIETSVAGLYHVKRARHGSPMLFLRPGSYSLFEHGYDSVLCANAIAGVARQLSF